MPEQHPTGEEILNGVTFTEDEMRVVQRLMGLGYDQLTVMQIFLICNRDEEATLGCLMSMG
jgi:hypothetical protein